MELIHLGPFNKDIQYLHISNWSKQLHEDKPRLILDCCPIGDKRGAQFETINHAVSDLNCEGQETMVLLPKSITPNDIRYLDNPEGKQFIFTLSEQNIRSQWNEYIESYDVSGVIIPPFKGRDTLLSSWSRQLSRNKLLYMREFISSGIVGETLFWSDYSFIAGVFTDIVINDSRCRMLYHPSMGRLYDVDKFFQFEVKTSSIIFNYNDYCVRCWLKGITGMEFDKFLLGGDKTKTI